MIERKCETCERGGGGCGLSDCRAPDWSHHFASRAALEAEVERLTKERDELRAEVAARDEEIAVLRARVEDWAAQYRALSARMESELGGLRHSLAEVEDERDEARKERDEARAAAKVAKADVARLGGIAFEHRMRAYGAESRVRELEAERDRHEAHERRLEALGFEPPGQDAHTCGDALGLRRLDEVDKDPPDPAKTSPV